MVYSSFPALIFDFSSSYIVADTISNLELILGPSVDIQESNLASALRFVTENIFAPNSNGYRGGAASVLAITGSHYDQTSPEVIAAAKGLRAAGADVYAISIGAPSSEQVEAIASEPYSTHIAALDTYSELRGLASEFASHIFVYSETTTVTTPSNPTSTPLPTVTFTQPARTTSSPAIVVTTTSAAETTTTAAAAETTTTAAAAETTTTTAAAETTNPAAETSSESGNGCPPGYIQESSTCVPICSGLRDVDIALAIDSSASITNEAYTSMLQFAADFIGYLPFGAESGPSVRLSLVNFAEKTDVQLLFKDNSQKQHGDIQNLILNSPYQGGGTSIFNALKTTYKLFESSGTGFRGNNAAVVLFSDGQGCGDAVNASGWLKALGVDVFTVGFGPEVNKNELKAIANGASADYVAVPPRSDPVALAVIALNLAKGVACGVVTVSPVVTDVCTNNTLVSNGNACSCSGMCVSCEINSDGKQRCLALETCPFTPMDIVIVLDSSNSLGQPDFPFAVQLVQNLINVLPVGKHDIHVALVSYSDAATVEFNFVHSFNGDSLAQEVSSLSFQGGNGNVANAFEEVRTKLIWSSINGYRNGPLSVVIIGDGPINSDTLQATRNLKAEGAHVYAVGVGLGNLSALSALVDAHEDLFIANNVELLREPMFAAIIGHSIACGQPGQPEPAPATDSPYSYSTPPAITDSPTSNNQAPVMQYGADSSSGSSGSGSGSSMSSPLIGVIAAVCGIALVAVVGLVIMRRAQSKTTIQGAVNMAVPPRLQKKKEVGSRTMIDLTWENEFNGAATPVQ